jgi:hypothetical protein
MALTPYSEGFYNGRKYEQERIIKILEKYLGEVDWEDLVKLIEGEKVSEDR